MATLSGSLTLAEIAKRTDPSGRAAKIGELLDQNNSINQDIPWVECNELTGHTFTQRTSLPTPTWMTLNTGLAPTVSSTAQVTDACGILGALVEVPKLVAEIGGNLQANIMSEATAHLEAMSQEFAGTVIAGNQSTAPNEFTGFYPRYNSTTGTTGQNVISASGSGSDNSSILLVGWAPGKIYGIYPKGTKAGLEQQNLGLQQVTTTAGVGSAGARIQVYQSWFYWRCGLAVQDWRYAVRIPNIDISNLVAKSSAADLFDLMIKAIHRIPNLNACTPRFYMNRTCFEMLDIQGRDDMLAGGGIKYENIAGQLIPTFRGIPIRIVDQIGEAESVVS